MHPSVLPFPLERWYARFEGRAPFDLSAATVIAPKFGELPPPDPDRRLGYGASRGDPALVAAILAHHPGATADNVLVTTGSIEALYLLQRVLLGPGDRFIAPRPGYGALYLTALEAGAEWVPWDVPWRQDADPWASWDTAMAQKPAVILINSPHNPTGFALTEGALTRMAGDAAAIGAVLIADEVQRGLQHDPPPPASTLPGRTVSVGSLSKTVGLPGLRLGWMVGPADVITACATLKDRTTLSVNGLAESIGTAVLQHLPPWLARSRTLTAANGALLEEWLADQPYLRGVVPEAGLTAFVRVAMTWPTLDLCDYLAETWGLLIAPGDYFDQPGFVRIGLGSDPAYFADGLARLRHGLDAYVPQAKA